MKGQMNPSLERPYPVYSNGVGENALYGYASEYRVEQESVTISARGTIGHHCYRPGKYTGIVRLITLIPREGLLAQYLNYALLEVELKSAGGGIPQLTVPMIINKQIVVPPLAEQKKIAAKLDAFDKLCNSTTEGLPGEIALRKRQYEFYRDRLLTFKKAG